MMKAVHFIELPYYEFGKMSGDCGINLSDRSGRDVGLFTEAMGNL